MTLEALWGVLAGLLGLTLLVLAALVLGGLWALLRRLLGLLLLLPLLESCGSVTVHVTSAGMTCTDGYPARLLLDASCRQGICGATCAPNRWEAKCP